MADRSDVRGDGGLTTDQVLHVARLARLRLEPDRIEQTQRELGSILGHLSRIGGVDVSGVEPMSHPTEIVNRLDDDEPVEPMPVDRLLALAPEVIDRFIAVPKILDEPSS